MISPLPMVSRTSTTGRFYPDPEALEGPREEEFLPSAGGFENLNHREISSGP